MIWRVGPRALRVSGAALLMAGVALVARPASAQGDYERVLAGVSLNGRSAAVLAKYGNPNEVIIGEVGVRGAGPAAGTGANAAGGPGAGGFGSSGSGFGGRGPGGFGGAPGGFGGAPGGFGGGASGPTASGASSVGGAPSGGFSTSSGPPPGFGGGGGFSGAPGGFGGAQGGGPPAGYSSGRGGGRGFGAAGAGAGADEGGFPGTPGGGFGSSGGPSGFAGGPGAAGSSIGQFGQTISTLARQQEVTWIFNRKVNDNLVSYEFLIGPNGNVVQIRVSGYYGGDSRTRRGASLGSTYKEIVQKYGYPEEHYQVGRILVASYRNKAHVQFQFMLDRPQANPMGVGNKVVAITIATVE